MTYYIVTIKLPTYSPGEFSIKKIFRTEVTARKYLKAKLTEDSVELPITEWDDSGPNWKILEAWNTGVNIIELSKID